MYSREACYEWIQENISKLNKVRDYVNYLYVEAVNNMVDGSSKDNLLIDKGKARAYKNLLRDLTRLENKEKGEIGNGS